ncbi:hypothetical protein M378DRAFT_16143 [Amanita muscaria Koide BX008]|uniref:Uncharacterized protein n=1 Tax=Amanita muscaria (strain Koide BX008) TaxID=946122 RepID=A0A0C2W8S7_AMAMK|nr:hypothetical protein M378DRAFT_16143 [Amanita muscaria Koide BX008]
MLVCHYRNGDLEDHIKLVTVDVIPQHETLQFPTLAPDLTTQISYKIMKMLAITHLLLIPIPIPRTISSRLSPAALQSSTKSAETES